MRDTAPPKIDDVQFVTGPKGITSIVLLFSERLATAGAALGTNYRLTAVGKDSRVGGTGDKSIQFGTPKHEFVFATGNPTRSKVTLTPTKSIKFGTFFQILALANSATPIADIATNPLDGDGNGTGGDNFSRVLGLGTRLVYSDAQRDTVTLTLARGGLLNLTLGPNGDGLQLTLPGANAASTLTGSIKKAKVGGDGRATLQFISGATAISDQLTRCSPTVTTACFQVREISAKVVDRLLESGAMPSRAEMR